MLTHKNTTPFLTTPRRVKAPHDPGRNLRVVTFRERLHNTKNDKKNYNSEILSNVSEAILRDEEASLDIKVQ